MAGNGSDPGVVDGSDLWITWTVSLDLHVRTLLATCAAHFPGPCLDRAGAFVKRSTRGASARQLSWLAEADVHSGRLMTARLEGCM